MKFVNGFKRAALARKARTVKQRIQRLEKEGLYSRNVEIFQKEIGGNSLTIPKKVTFEQYEEYERLLNLVFKDVWSTVGGAREVKEEREKNLTRILKRATGQDVDPQLVKDVGDYIPYEDLKEFLDNYVYEEIISVMHTMIKKGIPYSEDYANRALNNNIKSIIREILVERIDFSGDELSKGLVEKYVEEAMQNDINYAITQYQIDKNNNGV